MKYNFNNRLTIKALVILFIIPVILFSSCSSPKRVSYFQDISDSLNKPVIKKQLTFVEPRIKIGDLLSISVATIDVMSGGSAAGTGAAATITAATPTYLVDKNGNVDIPIVGRINVANFTTSEVKDMIYEKAQKYYVNPIVNVRFANFSISVLGDVNRPGTYTVPNEKVNVLDAIGLAGDMTITGRRDNILLVREEGDQKIFVRLDINSASIIQSPYFYLRSGDVLYIEPIKAKINSATADMSKDRYIPYIFSGLSLLLTIVNIAIQLNRK